MSAMNELSLEIVSMLEQDMDPRDIAKILDIPLHWVYEIIELFQDMCV